MAKKLRAHLTFIANSKCFEDFTDNDIDLRSNPISISVPWNTNIEIWGGAYTDDTCSENERNKVEFFVDADSIEELVDALTDKNPKEVISLLEQFTWGSIGPVPYNNLDSIWGENKMEFKSHKRRGSELNYCSTVGFFVDGEFKFHFDKEEEGIYAITGAYFDMEYLKEMNPVHQWFFTAYLGLRHGMEYLNLVRYYLGKERKLTWWL